LRQSNIIFAALLFAFIIYITIRGQLPSYLALFSGKGASSSAPTKTPTSSSSTGQNKDPIDTALAVYDKFSTMFT